MRHRFGALVVSLTLLVAGASGLAQGLSFTFDGETAGATPHGFLFSSTRQPSPGTWEVRGAGQRHHMAHVADPSAHGLAIAVAAAPAPGNIQVSSRIRFADGDRVGGLVWRYRDATNFYVVGINLQRHEANLHRIMGGNRIQLDSASDLNADPSMWHTLDVVHHGDQISVHFDGIAILHAKDRSFESGRAGVWSGGAAETWFSNITIEEFVEPRR